MGFQFGIVVVLEFVKTMYKINLIFDLLNKIEFKK
jgi:hypothetical protein